MLGAREHFGGLQDAGEHWTARLSPGFGLGAEEPLVICTFRLPVSRDLAFQLNDDADKLSR